MAKDIFHDAVKTALQKDGDHPRPLSTALWHRRYLY
jgi:hypothetical protein